MTKSSPAFDAALTYAAHGLKPFPIKARSKAPATAHGFKDATRDGGRLQRMFIAAGVDANVGIATGDGLIVIDLDGPEAEAWWKSKTEGDALWHTWIAKTARGSHLYYRVDRPVATRPQGSDGMSGIGPHVDVKGEGGYVLAPPSVHPDGPTYEWASRPNDIAKAPAWVLNLLDMPRASAPRADPGGLEVVSVGQDDHGARQAAMLAAKGLSRAEARAALEAMVATRFAGGWTGLDPSRPWRPEDVDRWLDGAYRKYYDPVAPALARADERLEARVRAKGKVPTDVERRVLRDDKPEADTSTPSSDDAADEDETKTGWERVDLGPEVRGEVVALPPRYLDRSDGAFLLYPRKLHWLSGEPEGLKSWLAQIAVADALVDGETAVYVDFEGDAMSMVARLRALGVSDLIIMSRLSYHRPEVPMSKDTVERLLRDVDAITPSVSVIDGVEAAMGASDLDSNHSLDFHKWWRQLGRRLQLATSGPTIAIDHVVKNPENRSQYASGTGQKLAAVDVHIGTIVVEPFGIGMTGRAKLVLHKDRPGALRPRALGRQLGMLTLASDAQTRAIRFSIEPAAGEGPDSADIRPTHLMEKVSQRLEGLLDGMKRSDLKKDVAGKAEYVIRAIDALISEGYVASAAEGNTARLASLKRYRAADDPRRNSAPLRQAGHGVVLEPEIGTVPNRSPIPGTVRATPSTTVPPLRGNGSGSGPGEQVDRSSVPEDSQGTGTDRKDLCAACGDVNWSRKRGKWYCGSCGEYAAAA